MLNAILNLPAILFGWITHPTTWVTGCAWLSADLLKVLLLRYRHGVTDWRRFFGTGGMPSSHTAFITGLATCIALSEGLQSPLFGLALGLVILTAVDAAGLRRSAGLQAEVLNQIVEDLYKGRDVKPPRVKEALGHTLPEVLGGVAVGVGVALLLYPAQP
jgi:acid phosphatase family membrane protein YuiD